MTIWAWMSVFSICCSTFSIVVTRRITRDLRSTALQLAWWKNYLKGYSPDLARSIADSWDENERRKAAARVYP